MKTFLLLSSLILALAYGCCCAATPPSYSGSSPGGSCQYGTYGETCTRICDNHPEEQDCFVKCTDAVRNDGYDATTCCKETWAAKCQGICSNEYEEDKKMCIDDCEAEATAGGVPPDSCVISGL